MSNISPLAFVHPEAKIGNNVTIEPFVFIDRDVVIGDNCVIRSHASIIAGTRMGSGNTIYHSAIIGADPQDFRWKGEQTYCIIGDNNKIYQQVIINRSIREGEATTIGSDSFIMAQSHIGHDSHIGNHCVIGNAVKIAGDCRVGNYSILSSMALMHEKCHVGEWVLIKGGCRINNNIPPYVIMAHNPITYFGVNAFILRKGNKSEEAIDDIARCYRHIYQCNTSIFNAIKRIEADVNPSPERDAIIDFIRNHDLNIAALPLEMM
ncbi:MAG: acyl-ACP--UDP-N-acetylglucosamine O-acyltransferase [Muribaculaceae bacterium]|jgi:UDP-N-acetylglucosamine acyltransferase|nr:acyl-ACP--UDP-N-acetylglucosamine O-acyltransferase [Muribaculaceae bacterium]MBQ1185464.1 acyl-ACP--UDP-N-acetylglucosamine O-acyltransferase [Muribaculaceae bacterium]MBQ2398968.1 acyl-ACP--UDP-N-acetylglucosamine O-acyltransferase [Muribaculaceae bacterium]MBQ2440435.1 acyl-ACP--UDP-N-acetylglucosamine O-acyltransferase [Muribaculaceae bacterium]MBQ5697566.1 acyl-ACP--UDP-N-acetylglucosamine O-acyltransferase [Muribaculaceae bacterium]